jgi:glycosyltransferase involved in cell wall biosynthesis
MSMGIPTIMSPVGVNNVIIEHGKNGYLADSVGEWVEILTDLIESENLRDAIGIEAVRTVEEKYSVRSQQKKYLQYFQEITTTQ